MEPRRDGRYSRSETSDTHGAERTARFTHPYVASTVRLRWTRGRTRGRSTALLIGYRMRCQGTTSHWR